MDSQQESKTSDSFIDDKTIEGALDMVPLPVVQEAQLPAVPNTQVDEDYEIARQNLLSIANASTSAVNELSDIAQQSQSYKAYDALASLVKSASEANRHVLGLAQQKKEIKGERSNPQANTVNNNLFVGSTAELLKFLKQNKVDV